MFPLWEILALWVFTVSHGLERIQTSLDPDIDMSCSLWSFPYTNPCTILLDTRTRFNFCSHYRSSYPKNELCVHTCIAHFVTQIGPKCLSWSNGLLEYIVISDQSLLWSCYWAICTNMAQGYSVSWWRGWIVQFALVLTSHGSDRQ